MTTQPVEGDPALAAHLGYVACSFVEGRITPLLGAGASLYAGPRFTTVAEAATSAPPSASELAAYLAKRFGVTEVTTDLLRVAQWAYAGVGGEGGLYNALHRKFDQDFAPTGLHDFLAEIPSRSEVPPLIVTTNYDDLVERALDEHGEQYDRVVYMAGDPYAGAFCHIKPDGSLTPINDPEQYLDVDPDKRTVVLKMHGYVARRRRDADDDSYVITEDDYIEYLSRTDLRACLPRPIVSRFLDNHLLFLGYSLRDWNVRAILYNIRRARLRDNPWWAVQLNPDPLEEISWSKRDVTILKAALEDYIPALRQEFLSAASAGPDSS